MPGNHTQHVHGYVIFDINQQTNKAAVPPTVRGDVNTNPPPQGLKAVTISRVEDPNAPGAEKLVIFVECATTNHGPELANMRGWAQQLQGRLNAQLNPGPVVFCCISDM